MKMLRSLYPFVGLSLVNKWAYIYHTLKHGSILLLLMVSVHMTLWAQPPTGLSLRAGYLQAKTILSQPQPGSLLLPPVVNDRPGFYLGLAYQGRIAQKVVTQLELNYQQKGQIYRPRIVEGTIRNTYHYVGLTPMVGIEPLPQLVLLVGPEVNVLVSKSTLWQNSRRVEWGLAARSQYQFNRFGLTAGYFWGLMEYDQFINGPYTFTNRSWQVGLQYRLTKEQP